MSLKASIDIAAPPSAVRAKFLDFAALPAYTRFFESIDSPRPGTELSKGDVVTVRLAGSPVFKPVVQTNDPSLFQWTGSLPFVFTGTHSFRFEPSSSIPGGTHFVQEEVFSGALSPLMGENLVARSVGFREKTRATWEGFNGDLKRVCEEGGK